MAANEHEKPAPRGVRRGVVVFIVISIVLSAGFVLALPEEATPSLTTLAEATAGLFTFVVSSMTYLWLRGRRARPAPYAPPRRRRRTRQRGEARDSRSPPTSPQLEDSDDGEAGRSS